MATRFIFIGKDIQLV